MPSYKHLALLVLLGITGSGAEVQLRGSAEPIQDRDDSVTVFAIPMKEDAAESGKNERMSTLAELNSSFNSIRSFVDQMDISDDMTRLEEIASRMDGFKLGFKVLEKEMSDDRASKEEWEEFAATVSGFSDLFSDVAENIYMHKLKTKLRDEQLFEDEDVEDEEEEPVPEDKDERIATLTKMNYSFDSVTEFLNNDAADHSDRLEAIATTMLEIAPIFEEMKDSMKKEGASEEAWKSFDMTLDRFSGLVDTVGEKIQASFEEDEWLKKHMEDDDDDDEDDRWR